MAAKMSLPAIAPYPPSKLRNGMDSGEWEACMDAWISVSDLCLRLPAKQFESVMSSNNSVTNYLTSYYREVSSSQESAQSQRLSKAHHLLRANFLVTHRALLGTEAQPPADFLSWIFLSDFSHAYAKSHSIEALLQTLWRRRRKDLETALIPIKASLIKRLESSQPDAAEDDLKRLASWVHASPEAGILLMTGSDFIDALFMAYPKSSQAVRQRLVVIAYLGLISLMRGENPNHSMLFDHLYSLKSQATGPSSDLLGDMITNTPLLAKLNTTIVGKDAERAHTLAKALAPLKSAALARPGRKAQRQVPKGKAPATENDSTGEQHMHRMSLITQIQDLFPDLGSGFITKLLDEYGDDVEQVTAHLLDDSLPSHLASLDRSASLSPLHTTHPTPQEKIDHLAPRSTPPPQRRNVFDNDAFDRLEVDASKLHIGRARLAETADTVLADKSNTSKAAILSALAAFDSDDDERDDTYDEADVGGTVDSARPDGEDEDKIAISTDNAVEEVLFRTWKADPALFGRAADTRRGKEREKLRAETGMTDEGIEGWGIMLARDPRRIRRLETLFASFDGRQNVVGRTGYREGEDTESDGGDGRRGGFRGRGRGRGRGAGGRGRGNVAGPASEHGTQVARDRKEAGKSSRANHNRRDQRARKMARGGFPG